MPFTIKGRTLIKILLVILIVFLVIFAIDYSGKVAKNKRYERYKTEPVTIETIALWNDWEKKLLSITESVNFNFKKEWIPEDEDQKVEINQVLKVVGDTSIIIEHTSRAVFRENDDITMMLRFKQNTKKLQGKFVTFMTFENTGMLYNLDWNEIPKTFIFQHDGKEVEIESYSYGQGEETLTFGIPYNILEQYNYQIDVLYIGLALYEYNYVGV